MVEVEDDGDSDYFIHDPPLEDDKDDEDWLDFVAPDPEDMEDRDDDILEDMNEDLKRELAKFGMFFQKKCALLVIVLVEELSEDDIFLLKLFAYKTEYHITREAYGSLEYIFPQKPIPSIKV